VQGERRTERTARQHQGTARGDHARRALPSLRASQGREIPRSEAIGIASIEITHRYLVHFGSLLGVTYLVQPVGLPLRK